MTAKNYNFCLDFVKGIACICVVLMHCEFPGILGTIVQTMSRFCVPFFFMVSGYFCFSRDGYTMAGTIMKRKVPHVLKITVWACLFYFCFVLFQQAIWHDQNLSVSFLQIRSFLLFNNPFIVAGQYWFLFALLYAYVFVALLEWTGLSRYGYWLALLMFIVYFTLAQGAHLAGVKMHSEFYRNWLVEGYAFFMLGHWIRSHQDKITISNESLLWIIGIMTALCLVERKLLGRDFGVNICTVPQVFAMFMYAVKNPCRHEGAIQRMGRDCSMLIYVLHPFVWHSMERVYGMAGITGNMIAQYALPVIVVVLSILLAMLCNWLAFIWDRKNQIAL